MLTLNGVRQALKAEFGPKCSVRITAEWTYSHWTKQDEEHFTVTLERERGHPVHTDSSNLAAAVFAMRECMGVNVPGDPKDVEIPE